MDELVVGTYEGFLLGYSLRSEDEVTKLKQTFATHSHTASVRCVSIAGRFLASGGTDDKVVVIDLKTRKEHTVLMNHDGTVNAVAFTHSGTHLISGSDDGSIVITRTGNWQIEKVWKKAHAGHPITAIAVHPSDKLALSLGGDKTLKTWNLIKGRPAFTINLATKGIVLPTEIKFSPSGDRFSIISQLSIDLWKISEAGLEKRITCTSKPTTVQWSNDEQVYVGLENGNILTLNVSGTQAHTYPAHKQRVKCVFFENNMLYTASSSGQLKVWAVDDSKLKEICSTNAGCRVTCVTLNKQSHLIKNEEKDEENDKKDELQESNNLDQDNEGSEEETKCTPKRKIGAYVTISYGDDTKVEKVHDPPSKKKRHRNKKVKNNKE